MKTHIESFPNRLAWLKSRRAGLGGSDAAVVCGEGYGSEYSLWADKCDLTPLEDDGELPEYVEAGEFLEPAIIKWWEHRTGTPALYTPLTIIRNPSLPFMFASTDALVGEDAGLDAKNASQWRAEEFEDGVPLGYQIQAQHYMAVTGRSRWHFACVLGGNKLHVSTVERNESFIARLIASEAEWWEFHVVGRVPPEPDGSEETKRAVKRAFPSHVTGEVRPLDDEFLVLRDRLLASKTEAGILKDEIDAIENTIKAALGTAEFGALPDGSGWTWKSSPRTGYVVEPTTVRTMRYKKAKER